MSNLINTVFPFNLYLSVLQLENYNFKRFIYWIAKNFYKRNLEEKTAFRKTSKTRLLKLISTLILLCVAILSFEHPIAILFLLVLLLQPYILLGISLLVIYIPEKLIKKRIVLGASKKVSELKKKGLKIIAITGSYGKSSAKEFTYTLLGPNKVLRTPSSYNTLLGIAKVIDLELDETYKFFVMEMSAYKRGEIKALAKLFPPDYALITGITSQHLERFGSLKNIVKAKFELVDSLKNTANTIFNLDSKSVLLELERRNIKADGYSIKKPAFVFVNNISFNKSGSTFTVKVGRKKEKTKSSLFGYSNIQNLAGAIAISIKAGEPFDSILKSVGNIKPFRNRFALRKMGSSVVVDNTYSSNEQSFKELVRTASKLHGTKALVTPGIVEQGVTSTLVHQRLGKNTKDHFDKFVLIGNNSRTKSFIKGLGNSSNKANIINDTRKDYFKELNKLASEYDWIFLENDLSQNY